ncbi:hypothetical protein HOY82DRAFT_601513 [Tuber indicum]|nr:hypothetical protein HOY82DRAFT_601513 [Tuber indicum]
MLDVLSFIEARGGNPEMIREAQRRRYAPVEAVDMVIALYEEGRIGLFNVDKKCHEINKTQKPIGAKKKAKEDASILLEQKKEMQLYAKLRTIGNIVHSSVLVSNNEDNNELIGSWAPDGVNVEKRNCLSHHDVLVRLDGYEAERGVKVVGHRGYYLKRWTPQFMLKNMMAKTAQLEKFDDELYMVVNGEGKNDKYLIAASEQLSPLFMRMNGCSRRSFLLGTQVLVHATVEGGGPRNGCLGYFQSSPVEQFVITHPEKSWEAYDQMIKYSEEFYKSLNIPYRVVAIVSGALNNAAAKRYDLEAWFHFQGEYKDLTDTVKKYVHCLNSTLCATERSLCYLLENYQSPEGINVPEPLRKYIPGAPEFLPFSKALPRNNTSMRRGKTKA